MKLLSGLLLLATGGGAFFFPAQDPAALDVPVTIRHADPKFRLTLPQGYVPLPKPPANAVYGYQRISGGDHFFITVELMGGTIDPEPLNEAAAKAAALKNMPPGSEVNLSKASWGSHELEIIESRMTLQGAEFFAISVQFPILPQAVQVNLLGPKWAEARVREDLKQVLGTFQGTTHWLTSRQRILRGLSGGVSVLSWLLLLIYGILYLLRYRGDVLRHWRFRVCYLTAVVVFFSLAIIAHVSDQAAASREVLDLPFYLLAGTALACAIKTGDLYKKGGDLRKAAAGVPAAPPQK